MDIEFLIKCVVRKIKQISYVNTYMWNLETWYDEPMTIETQTENEQVDMG